MRLPVNCCTFISKGPSLATDRQTDRQTDVHIPLYVIHRSITVVRLKIYPLRFNDCQHFRALLVAVIVNIGLVTAV